MLRQIIGIPPNDNAVALTQLLKCTDPAMANAEKGREMMDRIVDRVTDYVSDMIEGRRRAEIPPFFP